MIRLHFVARTLATAFLGGEWTAEQLVARGQAALSKRRQFKWLPRVVAAVLSQFGNQPPFPRWRVLAKFLAWHPVVRRRNAFRSDWPRASLFRLPPIRMLPAPALEAVAPVPSITTPGELADWLGLSLGELDWFADCLGREHETPPGPLRHYRYHLRRKSSGRLRILEVPKPRLKMLQRRILHGILDRIPPHPAAHAFRSGRSIATYVAPHSGQDVVLHVDLREYFPSIRASRIHALLSTVGYPEPVTRLLTGLCTNSTPAAPFGEAPESSIEPDLQRLYRSPHLPQGAPTSPALANLCTYRLDVRLTALAQQFQANYSRYADDLLFSGGGEFARGLTRFRILVLAIALDEGFAIQARKTRVLRQHHCQRVAGVVLNAHPNLPRRDYDQLRALLFNCTRHGPASQNHEARANFREHLAGRIAYFAMINPERGRKLREIFDRIDWSQDQSGRGA